MATKHEGLLEAAEEAINELFSDDSVSVDETCRSLQMLIDGMEVSIDSLSE